VYRKKKRGTNPKGKERRKRSDEKHSKVQTNNKKE
jgi:hypothetical protein